MMYIYIYIQARVSDNNAERILVIDTINKKITCDNNKCEIIADITIPNVDNIDVSGRDGISFAFRLIGKSEHINITINKIELLIDGITDVDSVVKIKKSNTVCNLLCKIKKWLGI